MKMTELGVREAAAAISQGDITAEDYAGALLDQTAALGHLNAFISLDADQVRTDARAADLARAKNGDVGPLHGVPLALKDNIDVAGMTTTGGTPGLKDHRPASDAPVTTALTAAGAIVLGKANMHELAFGTTTNNDAFGPARNPYDPERIPAPNTYDPRFGTGAPHGDGAPVVRRLHVQTTTRMPVGPPFDISASSAKILSQISPGRSVA